MPKTRNKNSIFYGWVIVGCVFITTFVAFGIAYSFAAFFASFQQEFGAKRGEVSVIFSLSGFLYFGLGALSGPVADRIGPARVVAAGMFLIAVDR